MKKILIIILALAFIISLCEAAQTASWVWRSPDGNPLPASKARQSVDGFDVYLLAIPYEDWELVPKNTQIVDSATFREVQAVKRGGKLAIIVLLRNPKLSSDNTTKVSCDVKVIRPNGTVSINSPNESCGGGPLVGDTNTIRVSPMMIVFAADPGDLAGLWSVQITVRDNVRGVSIPVETTISLIE